MNSKEFKKLLIVSSWAPPAVGGPQNLYNIFKFFPGDFFVLTGFYSLKNLSPQPDRWLSGEYIFFDNPKANKLNFFQESKSLAPTENKIKKILKKNMLVRLAANYFYRVFVLWKQIYGFTKFGLKAVYSKNIEVVLGVSDNGPALISAYIIHRLTGKPLYIYLFDLYKGNIFPTPLIENALAWIFEPRIFKSADKIILTNEGTREFYIQRYGKKVGDKITVIHNSIFPEPYSPYWEPKQAKKDKFEIIFTGNIYWAQIQSLKNLIQAVNEIKEIDIKFTIYSPGKKDYLKKIGIIESPRVKIDFALPDKMPEIQSKADILFLPLSWDTKSPEIINTATPGKLTDYLIAGKPILIHAPSSAFLSIYARKNHFALVVDENNVNKLKEAILEIISDKKLESELVLNAKETFFRNHDANKNADLFKSLFK